ncbi:hypothetical protein AK812_SmicGene14963 [Symbiodinium microadriaticum]|uniref:Endonuclease/exonuclease/phosphatase domain-containing protein n=1 Tax=Symbiodinium microadriaticum TaxID=2951 RepID=A0A1Q9E470_SYMMI|nr:hypothetical protein AK812_SmicGene14963 [Symbiodinium microadriaticum]
MGSNPHAHRRISLFYTTNFYLRIAAHAPAQAPDLQAHAPTVEEVGGDDDAAFNRPVITPFASDSSDDSDDSDSSDSSAISEDSDSDGDYEQPEGEEEEESSSDDDHEEVVSAQVANGSPMPVVTATPSGGATETACEALLRGHIPCDETSGRGLQAYVQQAALQLEAITRDVLVLAKLQVQGWALLHLEALMMLDARGNERLFLQLRFGTAPFALASLHLPHDQREDAFDVWTSTIEHVTQALGNVPVGHPVMIGGDFNQPLNTAQDTFSPMAQLRLLIARFRLRITEDVGPTWHARGLEAPLDFLLFRNEGMLGSATKREDLRLALPSDHDLVLTCFQAAPRARNRNRMRRDRCGRWCLQTEQWDSALAQLPEDPSEADLSAAFLTCSFRPKFPRYRDSEQVAGSYIQARGGQDAATKAGQFACRKGSQAIDGAAAASLLLQIGSARLSDRDIGLNLRLRYNTFDRQADELHQYLEELPALDQCLAARELQAQIRACRNTWPEYWFLPALARFIDSHLDILYEIPLWPYQEPAESFWDSSFSEALSVRLLEKWSICHVARYLVAGASPRSTGDILSLCTECPYMTLLVNRRTLHAGFTDWAFPCHAQEALHLPVAQSNLHDVIEVLDSQD